MILGTNMAAGAINWNTRGGGKGILQENWVGVCGTLPETLSLFQTKISDFLYPISDLTLKSIGAWQARLMMKK